MSTPTIIGPLAPPPVSTSTAIPTQTDPNKSGSNNYLYIYSFLSTLFILLSISLLLLLRAIVRRRRLNARLAEAAEAADRRGGRRKRRRNIGTPPLMSKVWIGDGPVSSHISLTHLLEILQPLSVAKKMGGTAVDQPVVGDPTANLDSNNRPSPKRAMFRFQRPSSHTESEKTSTSSHEELDTLEVGFLIAMPHPSLRGSRNPSIVSLPTQDDPETPTWNSIVPEGELPELSLGVSTLVVPSGAQFLVDNEKTS